MAEAIMVVEEVKVVELVMVIKDLGLVPGWGSSRLDVEVEGCFPSFPLLFSLQVQALPGRMLPLL